MKILFSVVSLSVLLTAGCFVETKKPLSDPATAQVDESLIGEWVFKSGDEEKRVSIVKHTVEGNPKTIMECGGFYFTVTRIRKDIVHEFLLGGPRD